ncbi:WD repeat-containing protein 34 [Kappamyces sp. JEL0829]|nr:WD repeat-containing protein 34 [Kappamyces sp. JEL0829]
MLSSASTTHLAAKDEPLAISFQDSEGHSTELKSHWKREKSHQTAAYTQTNTKIGVDAEVQSVIMVHAGNQTDKQRLSQTEFQPSPSTLDEVAHFLARAESLVSSQLIENSNSTAFRDYFVEWEEEIREISLSYTLSHDQPADMNTTALAWNCTGSTIAASYADPRHSSWCSHKGFVFAWNLSQRQFAPDRPSFMAETSTCLMSLCFHPRIPSLLAGGTFNGEIIVWKLVENQDPVLYTSKISDYSHQEPVTGLTWVKGDKNDDHFLLASVGLDGKILQWDLDNKLAHPVAYSSVDTKSIPRLLKGRSGSVSLGISAFSWTRDSTLEYILGTETGYVLRCSQTRAVAVNPSQPNTSSPNPVVFCYNPHLGPCTGVSFSPFHRNLFLTCSADGAVHLYHVLSSAPLLTWEPLHEVVVSVKWSPHKPSAFSCATAKGSTLVYDLAVSKASHVAEIRVPEAASASDETTTALAFNPVKKEVLAVGMGEGKINVWRLKSRLVQEAPQDAVVLEELGSVGALFV